MAIVAQSPTRVDLAGGTLDITPLTQILKHKMTVNFGITLDAQVTVRAGKSGYVLNSVDQNLELKGSWSDVVQANRLPLLERLLAHFWSSHLPPLQIDVRAKSPAGAGLGGSSCLAIAFASALCQARRDIGLPVQLPENQFVQTVQDIETGVINVPTGSQDYWGGLRGGINIIRYPPGRIEVETLRGTDASALQDLLILCYSGVSRASGQNNWAIFRQAFEGDKDILAILNEMGALTEQLATAVKAGSWNEVFRLSEAEWKLRVRMWSDIETKETQALSEAGKAAGAQFSRICGAGGGGVMAFFAEPDRHKAVCAALEKAGGRILKGTVSFDGTTVKGNLHD